VCGECEYGHVHGCEDGGLGVVAEVGAADLDEAFFVFGRERPPSVASAVMSQADRTCTSYKPKSVNVVIVLADELFKVARPWSLVRRYGVVMVAVIRTRKVGFLVIWGKRQSIRTNGGAHPSWTRE